VCQIRKKNVRTIAIIAISVACSVVAVIGVLALSDRYILSEEEQIVEDMYKEAREQNLVKIKILKEMCHERYDGKALEDCLKEIERVKQDTERILTP